MNTEYSRKELGQACINAIFMNAASSSEVLSTESKEVKCQKIKWMVWVMHTKNEQDPES